MAEYVSSVRIEKEDRDLILSKYRSLGDFLRQKVEQEFRSTKPKDSIAIVDGERFKMVFRKIDPEEERKKLEYLIDQRPADEKLLRKEYEALTGKRYRSKA